MTNRTARRPLRYFRRLMPATPPPVHHRICVRHAGQCRAAAVWAHLEGFVRYPVRGGRCRLERVDAGGPLPGHPGGQSAGGDRFRRQQRLSLLRHRLPYETQPLPWDPQGRRLPDEIQLGRDRQPLCRRHRPHSRNRLRRDPQHRHGDPHHRRAGDPLERERAADHHRLCAGAVVGVAGPAAGTSSRSLPPSRPARPPSGCRDFWPRCSTASRP